MTTVTPASEAVVTITPVSEYQELTDESTDGESTDEETILGDEEERLEANKRAAPVIIAMLGGLSGEAEGASAASDDAKTPATSPARVRNGKRLGANSVALNPMARCRRTPYGFMRCLTYHYEDGTGEACIINSDDPQHGWRWMGKIVGNGELGIVGLEHITTCYNTDWQMLPGGSLRIICDHPDDDHHCLVSGATIVLQKMDKFDSLCAHLAWADAVVSTI